jgi:predicted lipoprotein with Yx(FWY)xxD motif
MIRRTRLLLGLTAAAFIAAACSGPGTTTAPTVAAPTVAATPAAASPAASPAASTTADTTVVATEVGDAGTILVDGATGLTLYIFTDDVKDSGESTCMDACLETWPALTVATGETPTGGDGVTGTLGTITRTDNGDLQVTYDGLPLYFFKNDAAPGDLNGVYEKWETVAP